MLALAAALILASSVAPTPSRLNRALGWAPLVLIGQVSYGIYLWHWPVFTLLGPEQLHVEGWRLLMARLSITAALVAISYVLIERPYRFRRGPLHVRFLGGAVCVVGVVAAVLVWPTASPVSAARADRALAKLTENQSTVTATTTPVTAAAPAHSSPTLAPLPRPRPTRPRPPPLPRCGRDHIDHHRDDGGPHDLHDDHDDHGRPAADARAQATARRGDSRGLRAPPLAATAGAARHERERGRPGRLLPGQPDRPQIRFYTGVEVQDPCVNAITEWPAGATGR